MHSWFEHLKRGLGRTIPEDRLAKERAERGGAQANLRNLRPFWARHWRQGLLGAALVLFNTLLGFPQPLLQRALIDDAILGQDMNLLVGVIALMAGLAAIGMLTGVLQSWFFTRFQQAVMLDLRSDLLDRTLRFPKSFFDEREVGYLMSRLTSDVGGLRWFFSRVLVSVVSSGVQFIGGVVLLFTLEWRLALAALLVVPALVVWSRFFSRRSRALSHHSMERSANVTRRMQESLSSTSLIKAFASEKREVGRVVSEIQSTQEVALEQTAVNSLAGISLTVVNRVANLAVLAAGAYLVIDGQWTLGSLLAFRSYVGYVYGPARFLANVQLQLQNALAALERVSALYDILPEESDVGAPVERLRGRVALRDVSFSYDERQPVLQGVSCDIEPGERVAIVGPSGVGKTTLVSLLLRFYQPTSGEIWFDDRPASDYQLAALRRRIGYVSQSTILLAGTVLDNLRYGHPEATLEQVERACRTAGIHDFIAGLPEGYETQVGERGAHLSQGQMQRLSLARALIKDPDILVLDEPTSALDSVVERSIFASLPDAVRGKTLFVVAHRLSTVQDSDRILLLNENRLVAVGTHRSLLAENAFYQTLVANQQILTG